MKGDYTVPKKTFLRLDEDKQERVIRSAIAEFHFNGFERAKIGTIAEQAGVAKGSIYQYFEDKKDLFLYCVTWSMEYFLKNMNKRTPIAEMDVFEYLLKDRRERYESIKPEMTLILFYQDIMSGKFGNLTKTILDELWKIGDAYILQMIAVGKKKGTIRADADDRLLALVYKGVTSQLDEYIFGQIVKENLELLPDRLEEIEATIVKTVDILRKGMGC